jgi:hypothetical protein
LKVLGAVVLVGVVGFLVMRSAKSSRSAPYTVPADVASRPWIVMAEMASRPNDAVLVLRPPTALTSAIFDQTFKRSMESMRSPDTQGIPLVLQGELERAGAQGVSVDQLAQMARRAGLESAPPVARCVAHRRQPEPDAREQLYFAIFDSPAFMTFRQELASRLGSAIDPAVLSPVMQIGLVESIPEKWLPLRADAEKDCLAPIETAQK